MKRLLGLILILILLVSACSMMPLVSADEGAQDDLVPTILTTLTLNKPIGEDGIDYYMNITSPDKFASFGNVIVAEQGEDLLVKVDRHISYIEGALSQDKGTLRSITINNKAKNSGYIFVNFERQANFVTYVYSYLGEDEPELIGSISDFLALENIDKGTIKIDNTVLDNRTAYIKYSNNALYLVIYNAGCSIYKISSGAMSEISVTPADQTTIVRSDLFAVSNNSFYLYNKNGELYRRDITSSGSFEVINPSEPFLGVKDMVVTESRLYLLTHNNLISVSVNNIREALGDSTKRYEIPLDSDTARYNSLGLSQIGGDNFISVTSTDSHNITTYKESKDNGSLAFYNHYGANCVCDTPHQGWFNSPSLVVPNNDESAVYVVDNNGKRLVVSNKIKNNNYKQFFFKLEDLSIDPQLAISNIGVDRHDLLYVASGDKIGVYAKQNIVDADSNVSVTLNKTRAIEGFDGNIVDLYIHNSYTSSIYVLTDKNSLYKVTEEGDIAPILLKTFGHQVKQIAPSFDNTRMYVATNDNKIECFPITDINDNTRLSLLPVEYGIRDFVVDYYGDITVLADNNRLYTYSKSLDASGNDMYTKSYKYWNNRKSWNDLQSFFIKAGSTLNSAILYTVDASTHQLERYSGSFSYRNDAFKVSNPSQDKFYEGNDLTVAKTADATRMYSELGNYEMYRDVQAQEYFYILAEAGTDMYYVVDSNNEFGFVRRAMLENKIPKNNESTIGNKFRPLFNKTVVYRYPFDVKSITDSEGNVDSRYIIAVLYDQEMEFVDNVAYDIANQTTPYVWQNSTTRWIKVKFIKDNLPQYGYVKMNEITKVALVDAPSTSIHVKVTAKVGEIVKMYDQPDLASGVLIDNVPDGTMLRLRQNEFNPDSEFTCVELEKDGKVIVGYILTANLQQSEVTNTQSVVILAVSITVVVTILVILLVILYVKKKKKINTFKSDNDITPPSDNN